MTEIWVERRKWPDLPHYGHAGWVLGEDEFGLWIELRAGPVFRGDEVLFHGSGGGLMLAPPHDGWLAWFPEHRDFDLYVDIVCDLERSSASVTMIDLDLDVVRTRDGKVKLLDEDEFELHQVQLGYTPAMIDHATTHAARVLAAVSAGEPPFDGEAAATWRRLRQTDV